MRQREDSPTDWKNQDAEMPVDGWIPPLTGCFAPLEGLLPGRFPQSLEESGLRSVRQREDSPTDWMFSDSGMLTNGKIPPLTGGIRTLENLADSTDAEYEEDRPEKQFLRKLQWMWE